MPADARRPPVRALTIHADYACGHSGRCCTAGWPIAVEIPIYRRLSAALASGRLQPPPAATAGARTLLRRDEPRPADAAATLGRRPSGACVFFDGPPSNLCAVHRQGGVDWLPSACRHFPRIATLDARGIAISLSHYCPTAAGQLFRTDVPLAITGTPPAFPPDQPYEGLDARDAWPPLLRPGVLADLETCDLWEAHLVRSCADDRLSPEAALHQVVLFTEALHAWTPDAGPLVERARQAAAAPPSAACADVEAFASRHLAVSPQLHRLVTASIPAELRPAEDVHWLPAVWRERVESAWRQHARPIRCYLAARGFASWLAYQSEGLRTVTAGLAAALGVLRVEAVRLAAGRDRPFDAALLLEAIRESDRRLVHLASPESLAHHLAAAEASPAGHWLQTLADSRAG